MTQKKVVFATDTMLFTANQQGLQLAKDLNIEVNSNWGDGGRTPNPRCV